MTLSLKTVTELFRKVNGDMQIAFRYHLSYIAYLQRRLKAIPSKLTVKNPLIDKCLPFFTWFLLYRIHKRMNGYNTKETLTKVGWRFLAGLLFAVTISICFVNGIQIVDYIMGTILLLAFVFPLYKSEYVLGWVLGSSYTFGAVLPMGFGSILCLLFFLVYALVQWVKKTVRPGTN